LLRVLNPSDDEAKQTVVSKYNLSCGLPIASIQQLVVKENHRVTPYLFLEGGSLPTDLFLLAQLAQREEVNTYFEIGTWRGESVMNVAPFVQKAYTLNLTNEEMIRRGANPQYVAQSGMLLHNKSGQVEQLYGDSLSFDFTPWYQSCDLIFIDGDHHYSTVVSDSKNALKLRRSQNSVIVWHDYGYSPEEIRWEILQAILDAVPTQEHPFLYHIAHTKCAILTRLPLTAAHRPRPMKPDTIFEIDWVMKPLKS